MRSENERSQDYLVNNGTQPQSGQNENTQAPYRLFTPGFAPSISGGTPTQVGSQVRTPQGPDLQRQKFRATNRQISENRPVDFNLGIVNEAKNKGFSDLQNKFKTASDSIGKNVPDTSDFLPDYQKAKAGDALALTKTTQRLNTPLAFNQNNISTTAEDSSIDYLRAPSQAAFLNELAKSRGGGLSGINRLEAAILERSGAGRDRFNQGRKEIENDIYFQEQNLNNLLFSQNLARNQDYTSKVQNIRGMAEGERGNINSLISQRIADYKNRDVSGEVNPIIEKARALAEAEGLGGYFNNSFDSNSFVDRDLTREEAAQGDEAKRFNDLADMLGGRDAPMMSRGRDPGVQENALISRLLEEARGGRQTAIDRADEAARQAQKEAERLEALAQFEEQQRIEQERVSRAEMSPYGPEGDPEGRNTIDARDSGFGKTLGRFGNWLSGK